MLHNNQSIVNTLIRSLASGGAFLEKNNTFFNFESFLTSFRTLLVLTSFDSLEEIVVPHTQYSFISSIFFLSFILLVAYFLVGLLLGVVVDAYEKNSTKQVSSWPFLSFYNLIYFSVCFLLISLKWYVRHSLISARNFEHWQRHSPFWKRRQLATFRREPGKNYCIGWDLTLGSETAPFCMIFWGQLKFYGTVALVLWGNLQLLWWKTRIDGVYAPR